MTQLLDRQTSGNKGHGATSALRGSWQGVEVLASGEPVERLLDDAVCVVIPAFNEGPRLERVLKGVKRHHPTLPVVVVDDGSEDETSQVARASGAIVLRHGRNRGYGEALLTAYRFVHRHGGRAVVQLDGDGQHPPEELGRLLEALHAGAGDLILGSRYSGRGRYEPGVLRSVVLVMLRRAIQGLTGLRIQDPTSGFQALNRRCLEHCLKGAFPPDYPDSEVLVRLHRQGLNIHEVPVLMHPSTRPSRVHQGLRPLHYLYRNVVALTALAAERNGSPHPLNSSLK